MKYNRNYKPELCVSSDVSREGLCFVELDGTRLIATDGTCLVSVPCERENAADKDGAIAPEVLKAARKDAKARKTDDAEVKLTDSQATIGQVTMPRGVRSANFPPWKMVVPQKRPPTIGFNAKLLAKIADALGSEDGFVALALPEDPGDPILIYTTQKSGKHSSARFEVNNDHETDPFAVLMPSALATEKS